VRPAAVVLLLPWSLVAASCLRRPPASITAPAPPRVFVQLEVVQAQHPAHAVRNWKHEPMSAEQRPVSARTELSVGRELTLNLARRPDEPLTPVWTTQREQVKREEAAATALTFDRAQSLQSDSTRFLEEELRMALADALQGLKERLLARRDADAEAVRNASADKMDAARRKYLRTSALEKPAETVRRTAARDRDLQLLRNDLATAVRKLDDAVQTELAREERRLRDRMARELAEARAASHSGDVPGREAQLQALSGDFQRLSPARLGDRAVSRSLPPLSEVAVPEQRDPVVGAQPFRAGPNLTLIADRSRDETRALIRQWAKIHYCELVGFERSPDAADRTSECLAWLRNGVWKYRPKHGGQ